jgi:4-hydroxy-tetrahydrodipicolinate reductase
MGQAIARAALEDAAFAIGAALEAAGHPAIGQDYATVLGRPLASRVQVSGDERQAIGQGDVVIEFTSPEATAAHARIAQELRKPMVIGTTGLSDAQREALRQAARTIPMVVSPNMSVGVNVLFEAVALAAARLGPSYGVKIIEAHHRNKKDAPSGTAKRLQELIGADVPCESIREGEIVGDHTVVFSGPFERLELAHHAEARDVFAVGAVKAARFVAGQPPGWYDMSHVLKAAQA